jgi:hypothetical protein
VSGRGGKVSSGGRVSGRGGSVSGGGRVSGWGGRVSGRGGRVEGRPGYGSVLPTSKWNKTALRRRYILFMLDASQA